MKHKSVKDLEQALYYAAAQIECAYEPTADEIRSIFHNLKEKTIAAERHVKDFNLDALWELVMTLEHAKCLYGGEGGVVVPDAPAKK
jgi:hypothetical protein